MRQDSRKQNPLNNSVGIRLQKYLADCGLGSRRACESLIASGRVCVDGVPVDSQGVRILPVRQQVHVDGHPVRPQMFVYLLLNKPADVLCTSSDEKGRRTIHALLPDLGVRVYSVGRLDRQSEGLLLVTNDGNLAARLMHPRYHVGKEYRVWCAEQLTDNQIQALRDGMICQGDVLHASDIRLDHAAEDTYCYAVILHEGKNRQIRRMFDAVGVPVLRLLRVAIGPIGIGSLKSGSWRHMTLDELRCLRAETDDASKRLCAGMEGTE